MTRLSEAYGCRAGDEIAPAEGGAWQRERAVVAACASAIRPAVSVLHHILPVRPFGIP